MKLFFFSLVTAFLALCAAVLSASETAVTAASRLRLHQLSKKGKKKANLLLALQDKMSSLISAILFSNMWLLSSMTALTTHLITSYLGEQVAMVVAPLFMGVFLTIYVEVLPKIYVYRCPEKVGIALAPMLSILQKALSPITTIIDKIAYGSLALFGFTPTKNHLSENLEDLLGAIDLHTGSGSTLHERAMLRSILDLSHVTVEAIMVHRKNIVSFNVDLSSEELCSRILEVPYTRVPLWRSSPDNIIGVVNVKSLAKVLKNMPKEHINFESIMKTPWFIPDTSTLFAQLQLFREKSSHQAFVVDEYGSLLGMVTLEDILEEIVGEITDEHDVAIPGVRPVGSGMFVMNGSVTLRDLHRQYEWNFGDVPFSTLAGLILNKTRTIPQVDTIVEIEGFSMKILRVHHHQIVSVLVTPPGTSPPSLHTK